MYIYGNIKNTEMRFRQGNMYPHIAIQMHFNVFLTQ